MPALWKLKLSSEENSVAAAAATEIEIVAALGVFSASVTFYNCLKEALPTPRDGEFSVGLGR